MVRRWATGKYYNCMRLNGRNPLTWHIRQPLWPFLRSIQPPEPPKISGNDAVELVVDVMNWAKRQENPRGPQ